MKKRYVNALCGVAFALLGTMAAQAYDFKVDGIAYDVLSWDDKTCRVVNKIGGSSIDLYEGVIHVPEKVRSSFTVTAIGGQAFEYCRELVQVTLPNTITSIGAYAFYTCESLTSFTIPNSVLSIGYNAFHSSGIETCIIEDGKNTLTCGNRVFALSNIKYLYLGRNYAPDNDGDKTFEHMNALEEVVIGPHVTSITKDMFVSSNDIFLSNFKKITILPGKSSDESQIAINNHVAFRNIEEFSLGKSVSEGSDIYIPSVVSVELNENCSRLPAHIFKDTYALNTIVCRGKVPPTFDGDPGFRDSQYWSVRVSVPADALAAYQADDVWGKFWSIANNTGLETLLQDPDAEFAVYNVQGILVQQKCTPDELRHLPKDVYILVSETGRYKVTNY